MARQKDYFGLDYVVSMILCIFMITNAICSVITRLQEGKIVAALVRIFLGWNIIWLLDVICMATNKEIFRLLDC